MVTGRIYSTNVYGSGHRIAFHSLSINHNRGGSLTLEDSSSVDGPVEGQFRGRRAYAYVCGKESVLARPNFDRRSHGDSGAQSTYWHVSQRLGVYRTPWAALTILGTAEIENGLDSRAAGLNY